MPPRNPFTAVARMQVRSVGETGLIARIRDWLGDTCPPPPHGIGDDCAVLPAMRGRVLVTVDPVVFGRHFDSSVSPFRAGAKLMKRNLSDIAAMGGRPAAAVVALALDARVSLVWLEDFYRGIAVCARAHGVRVVGGDIAQAPGVFAATLTLLGQAGRRQLLRSGTREGDWIYVTGRLGGSLSSGRHHRFMPRLVQGRWLAARRQVRSMMDVSDGLAKDLPALAPRGCVPAINPAAIPRHRGIGLKAALCEGEDYELVFSLARDCSRTSFEKAWTRMFPRLRISLIGSFVRKGLVPAGWLDLSGLSGYEHLRD